MLPYNGFEQNAQSVRIVTRLEAKFPAVPNAGLNLTRATLDGILKYKMKFEFAKFKDAPPEERKFYYSDDQGIVNWISKDTSEQSFECQIMDWSDDAAYAVHDLEDALHFGLITFSMLNNGAVKDAVLKRARKKLKGKISETYDLEAEWTRLTANVREALIGDSFAVKRARRKQLTSALIAHFVLNVSRKERPADRRPNKSIRYRFELEVPDHLRACQQLLTSLVWERVIESRPGRTLKFKSNKILDDLWKALVAADKKGHVSHARTELLPQDWAETLSPQANLNVQMRAVCDFLAGMTDEYARRVHAWLYDRDEGWHPYQLP